METKREQERGERSPVERFAVLARMEEHYVTWVWAEDEEHAMQVAKQSPMSEFTPSSRTKVEWEIIDVCPKDTADF